MYSTEYAFNDVNWTWPTMFIVLPLIWNTVILKLIRIGILRKLYFYEQIHISYLSTVSCPDFYLLISIRMSYVRIIKVLLYFLKVLLSCNITVTFHVILEFHRFVTHYIIFLLGEWICFSSSLFNTNKSVSIHLFVFISKKTY